MKKKGTGLRYIPIHDFNLIPRYLIEQVKPRTWDVDRLYQLGPVIVKSPFNILAAYAGKDGEVKGFFWGAMNPLDEELTGYILSVDKEYQGKGMVNENMNILRKIKEQYNLKNIKWQTTRPKAFEKMGYKRSKSIIMEV